jgi:hypothetical protein
MPLTAVTRVFGVKEMKIYALLTDPVGGPATYGTGVPLTGATKLTLNGTIDSKWLKGDSALLDGDAVWDQLEGTVEYRKLSLDAMQIFLSTVEVTAGTTPNQTVTYGIKSTDTLKTFRIDGRALAADYPSGDVLFSLPKCKLMDVPTMGLMEKDYQVSAFNFMILPRYADSAWMTVTLRETSAALTTT